MPKPIIPQPRTAVVYQDGDREYGAVVVPPKDYEPSPDDPRVDLVYRDPDWRAVDAPEDTEPGRDIRVVAVPHTSRVEAGGRCWREA